MKIEVNNVNESNLKEITVKSNLPESLNKLESSFREGIEDNDSMDEIYKRRMNIRQYFKELKMNMDRIKKSK